MACLLLTVFSSDDHATGLDCLNYKHKHMHGPGVQMGGVVTHALHTCLSLSRNHSPPPPSLARGSVLFTTQVQLSSDIESITKPN
jgi:hypothetical protein